MRRSSFLHLSLCATTLASLLSCADPTTESAAGVDSGLGSGGDLGQRDDTPQLELPATDVAAIDPGSLDPGTGADPGVTTDTPDSGPVVPADQKAILAIKETEAWELPGLEAEVHVVRTEGNVPHLYAKTRKDLGRAFGFVFARDRYFVTDLERRLALGNVSELIGDVSLDRDIEGRQRGMAYVTERVCAGLSPALGEWFDAVADGFNAYIAAVKDGKAEAPSELGLATVLLGAKSPVDLMKPFTRKDFCAIVTVIAYETNFEGGDPGRQNDLKKLTTAFTDPKTSQIDEARRKAWIADVWNDLLPLYPEASSTDGLGFQVGQKPGAIPAATPALPSAHRPIPAELLTRVSERNAAFAKSLLRNDLGNFGSNAWAVGGYASKSGETLVCSDGHLQLSVPALMYQLAFDTTVFGGPNGFTQAGLTLASFPGLAVGTNGHVAWGSVNPFDDITDWYREEIQLDAKGVPAFTKFNGEWKPIKAVEETFVVADVPALDSKGRTEKWLRFETFDGRWITDVESKAVPAEGAGATETIVNFGGKQRIPTDTDGDKVIVGVSFDYTAFDTTALADAMDSFGSAKNMDDFRDKFRGLVGNMLFTAAGDSKGDIFYSSYQARPCRGYLPRDKDGTFLDGADPTRLLDGTKYGGFTMPSKNGLVDEEPGKTDPYQCVIPFEETPQAKNPKQGYLVTANNDPGGLEKDGNPFNDKWYLGGPYDSVRSSTIGRALAKAVSEKSADVAKMGEIQGNHDSRLGELFVPHLLDAIDVAAGLAKTAGLLTEDEQRLVTMYIDNATRITAARERLDGWGKRGFQALSGVQTFYHQPAGMEKDDAVATMLFAAFLPRFLSATFGDEAAPYRHSGDYTRVRMARKFLDGRGDKNPKQHASWDPATGESVFFDTWGTPEVERSREHLLKALVGALDFLTAAPTGKGTGGFGTDDMSQWLYGLRHQVKFTSLLADYLDDPKFAGLVDGFSITTGVLPLADKLDPKDPRADLMWFPRPGDQYGVDAANPGMSGTNFTHGSGPVMRMVISLKDGKVSGQNIIPGGQSAISGSKFFADQAKLWLGNQAHPLRFHLADVVAGATGREVFRPKK